MEKLGWSFWFALLVKEQLHPRYPQPHREQEQTQCEIPSEKTGVELCVQAHMLYLFFIYYFFLILMPKGSGVTCAFSFKDSKVNQILAGKL